MPMVSRVRDALRRLIDDYGSSDEDKGKAPAPVRPKKSKDKTGKQDKIFFRKSGTGLKNKGGTERQASLSSSSNTSSEDDPNSTVGKEQVEEHPIFLSGLLGTPDSSVSADTSAIATENGGDSDRVRAFGHFPGNWATFVYLIPRTEGLTSLFNQLIHEVANIGKLRPMKWSLIEEVHVSLSRTAPLRYHEIPHFTAHLKAEIVKTSLPRFSYSLEDVAFFKNDQVNTSFLALKVGRGQEDMLNLLKTVDTCLKSFSMPPFYENPEFHVSFAWSTERVSDEEKKIILDVLQEKFETIQDQFSEELIQHVKAVHCKSGNRTYLIPL